MNFENPTKSNVEISPEYGAEVEQKGEQIVTSKDIEVLLGEKIDELEKKLKEVQEMGKEGVKGRVGIYAFNPIMAQNKLAELKVTKDLVREGSFEQAKDFLTEEKDKLQAKLDKIVKELNKKTERNEAVIFYPEEIENLRKKISKIDELLKL